VTSAETGGVVGLESGGQPTGDVPGGSPWVVRILSLFAAGLLAVLWIVCYPACDVDDKAVHYYSAARLFAGSGPARAVDAALPEWLCRVGTNEHSRFRLQNRIVSFRNYLVPSALLRLAAGLDRAAPGEPPRSFTRPLRAAFFLAHAAALCWILAVSWRSPALLFLVLTALVIAAHPGVPAWLAAAPRKDMGFLIYVPRGSAILVLLGALAALQQSRWWLALAGVLLVFGWHGGFACVGVPLAGCAAGIAVACRAGFPRVRYALAGTLVLLAVAASFAAQGWMARCQIWCPLVIAGGWLLRGGRAANPCRDAAVWAAGFLGMTGLLRVLLDQRGVLPGVIHLLDNELAGEIPLRVGGLAQVAAAILLASLAGVAVSGLAKGRPGRAWIAALLPLVMVGFMAVCAYHFSHGIRAAARRDNVFFRGGDDKVIRLVVTESALADLDPGRPPSFFASLGDFLLRGGAAGSGR